MNTDYKEKTKNEILSVLESVCTSCGICTQVCPRGVLSLNEQNMPVLKEEKGNNCINCGQCAAACPSGALEHAHCPVDAMPDRFSVAEEVEALLKTKRSVRVFQEKPVEEDLLNRLIETASCAPSGGNARAIDWIVIKDSELLNRIREMTAAFFEILLNQNHEITKAVPIEAMVDQYHNGNDPILRNAPAMIIARAPKAKLRTHEDIPISLSYFEIAAHARGLGTCWLGMIQQAASFYPPLRELLGLGEDEVYYNMLVGYPKYDYKRIPRRKGTKILFK